MDHIDPIGKEEKNLVFFSINFYWFRWRCSNRSRICQRSESLRIDSSR